MSKLQKREKQFPPATYYLMSWASVYCSLPKDAINRCLWHLSKRRGLLWEPPSVAGHPDRNKRKMSFNFYYSVVSLHTKDPGPWQDTSIKATIPQKTMLKRRPEKALHKSGEEIAMGLKAPVSVDVSGQIFSSFKVAIWK